MQNFKKLMIWQKGIEIASLTIDVTKAMPTEHKFGLGNQMNKSAISISSNIAEGSSRRSDKEQVRFLEIAIGSAYELETQVEIAEVNELIPKDMSQKLKIALEEEVKMIFGYKKKFG